MLGYFAVNGKYANKTEPILANFRPKTQRNSDPKSPFYT
jgi:hypothetical protein